MAVGLEWQAAQDRDDQLPQLLGHGLWRWLRMDDGQPGTAGLFPGRHEWKRDQSSPDSPGVAGTGRRRRPRRTMAQWQIVDRGAQAQAPAACRSQDLDAGSRDLDLYL